MKTKQVKRRKTKNRRKTRKTWRTGGATPPNNSPVGVVTNPLRNESLEQSEPTAVNKPLVNVSTQEQQVIIHYVMRGLLMKRQINQLLKVGVVFLICMK